MPIKILLVDDHFLDTVLTMRAMGDCEVDHEIVATCDGEDALDLLVKYDVDLVLLDIKMQRVDGFEFMKRLRGTSSSTIPIIIVSGSDQEVDRQRAASLGAVDYVQKAMDYSEFKKQLRSALARQGFC